MLGQRHGNGVALVRANPVLARVFQRFEGDFAVGLGQHDPVVRTNWPDPFEKLLTVWQTRHHECTVTGIFQCQLVDPFPRKTQGQAIGDVGTLEHFADDVHGDAIDVLILSEVLAILGHVVGREVFRQQHQVRGGAVCSACTTDEQQGSAGEDKKNAFKHVWLPKSMAYSRVP
ncbi:hypothetical protein D3C78_1333180 [compost metagenome]